MKSLNWTIVVITIAMFVIGWLFIPSPLHKCPVVRYGATEVVRGDTATSTIATPGLVMTTGTLQPVTHSTLYIPLPENPDSVVEAEYMVFEGTVQHTLPADSTAIVSGKDTLGYAIIGISNLNIRSNTFYFPGDTLAQTNIDVNLEPRPIEIHIFKDTTFQVVEVPTPDEPVSVYESPIFWATVIVAVGTIINLIAIRKSED